MQESLSLQSAGALQQSGSEANVHRFVVGSQVSSVHTLPSVQSASPRQHCGISVYEHVFVDALQASVVQTSSSSHWALVEQQPGTGV